MKGEETYKGIEVGPIRPPSEAHSLLLRLTRNCPWNRCKFCGLYKGERFSRRPVEHIIKDIDLIRGFVSEIDAMASLPYGERHVRLEKLQNRLDGNGWIAFHMARDWYQAGMKSIFFQDANSLVMKTDDMVEVLEHLRGNFPEVERITTYARSSTVAKISDDDMKRIARAGLNRIHIGMESASDKVLEFVKKGVNKDTHIAAGLKVKQAAIELSEYFMPGLGGRGFSNENALETADAINQINPDFIRIRTLAVPEGIELHEDIKAGTFEKMGDVDTARELLLFIENLGGITSTLKSDHILNLFEEVEGELPEDKEKITAPINEFLSWDAERQMLYMVGRRAGVIRRISDMDDPVLRRHAEDYMASINVTAENVDEFTAQMMKRFI